MSCSLCGQSLIDKPVFNVPGENIIRANTLFFNQKNRIETLLALNALRQEQYLNLKLACALLMEENTVNEQIIDNQNLQIQHFESMVAIHKTQNRVLITVSIILLTYIVVK